MAKKWHTRGSSAISSALAVVILAGAGVAMASQGSMAEMVSGAKEAIFGTSEPVSDELVSGGSGHTRGTGDGTLVGEEPGSAATCIDAVAEVRGQMPDRGNASGIEHAIDVVSGNCMKNPTAAGLMNALKHMLDHGGGRGKGHAYGHGPGHPGDHGGKPNHPGNQGNDGHKPQIGNHHPGNPGNGNQGGDDTDGSTGGDTGGDTDGSTGGDTGGDTDGSTGGDTSGDTGGGSNGNGSGGSVDHGGGNSGGQGGGNGHTP